MNTVELASHLRPGTLWRGTTASYLLAHVGEHQWFVIDTNTGIPLGSVHSSAEAATKNLRPAAVVPPKFESGSLWRAGGVVYILTTTWRGYWCAVRLPDGYACTDVYDSPEAAVRGLNYVCDTADITIKPRTYAENQTNS